MFYNVLFFIVRSFFHLDMVWYGVGVGTQLSHPRFFEKLSLRHHLHAKILRGKIPGQQNQGKGTWDTEEKKANASWYVTKQDTASQGNLALVPRTSSQQMGRVTYHTSVESLRGGRVNNLLAPPSPPCSGLKFVPLEVNSLVGWVTHFLCVANGQASL